MTGLTFPKTFTTPILCLFLFILSFCFNSTLQAQGISKWRYEVQIARDLVYDCEKSTNVLYDILQKQSDDIEDLKKLLEDNKKCLEKGKKELDELQENYPFLFSSTNAVGNSNDHRIDALLLKDVQEILNSFNSTGILIERLEEQIEAFLSKEHN